MYRVMFYAGAVTVVLVLRLSINSSRLKDPNSDPLRSVNEVHTNYQETRKGWADVVPCVLRVAPSLLLHKPSELRL